MWLTKESFAKVPSKLTFLLYFVLLFATFSLYNFLGSDVLKYIHYTKQKEHYAINMSHEDSYRSIEDTNKEIPYEVIYKDFTNPPRIMNSNSLTVLHKMQFELQSSNLTDNMTEKLKANLLRTLSAVVQEQLNILHNPDTCHGLNLVCGHQNSECGLGCQIHHRIGCLIVSYSLGIPLIHDEDNWPYENQWTDAFLPLGSRCRVGPNTYRLVWNWRFPIIYRENGKIYNISGSIFKKHADQIKYPLSDGIIVSKDVDDLVEIVHPSPFLWWIGQFMKFGLRSTEKLCKIIAAAKEDIKFKPVIVGLQIRRTDKVTSKSHTFHSVDEYMSAAEMYYRSRNIAGDRNIFLATDEVTVLNSSIKIFEGKGFNIIGFQSRLTHSDPLSRSGSLFEILTDLFLLLECDFVICDFSSNICSLVLEMKSFLSPNGNNCVKTLQQKYTYKLFGKSLKPKIIKI